MELERRTKLYHFHTNDGVEGISKISQALKDKDIGGFLSNAESKEKEVLQGGGGCWGKGQGVWKWEGDPQRG